MGEGSHFQSSEGGLGFYLDKDVDFGFSSSFDPTDITIYQYDQQNRPEFYLLKKEGKAFSAETKTKTFPVGQNQQFLTLNLFDDNIIHIESIKDSAGNIYHEVDYLAQDTIFDEVENIGTNDPELLHYSHQTPYLLKVKRVPRRFVTRFKKDNSLEIQFGAGSTQGQADEEILPNPDNIGLGIADGRSKLNIAYDPSNFLYTRAYGQTPSNTNLTVTYLIGGGMDSNVPSNTITKTGTLLTTVKPNLSKTLSAFCLSSVACTNPEPAIGGGSGDTLEEIRMNAVAAFSAQSRTVTKDDYIIRTLSMPAKFGRVAKCYITQDDQISPLTTESNRIPNPLAINLYILGYDRNKYIANLNKATKQNIQTYLEQHRPLTDAVNIKNAYWVNFKVDFEITTFKNFNNQQVILDCINDIKAYFSIDKWQINQPIIESEVYNL